MVLVIEKEESLPSWLVHMEPMWLCEVDKEDGNLGMEELHDYMSNPFFKQEFEPYGWHDILATLDVCANVHATNKHSNDEGYDIVSYNMVSIVMNDKNREISHQTRGDKQNKQTKSKSTLRGARNKGPHRKPKRDVHKKDNLSHSSHISINSRSYKTMRNWKRKPLSNH